jgi:hypothetical protein
MISDRIKSGDTVHVDVDPDGRAIFVPAEPSPQPTGLVSPRATPHP